MQHVTLITDQQTGLSKRYAFIDLLDETGARLAIKELDGSEWQGRTLSVRVADKQLRPRTDAEIPVAQKRYEKVKQPGSKRPRIRKKRPCEDL